MTGNVEIKYITKDCIEILGKTYYSEEYFQTMMKREYSNGYRDGLQKPVIHKVEKMKLDDK